MASLRGVGLSVKDDYRMPDSLDIDDALLEKALELGGHRTKRETVNEALKEYVARRKRLKVLEAFGSLDFDPKYNHKQSRQK
jgi:Arc/MetJ family transcription regulator